MSDFCLRKNAERIQNIPASGEKVQLVEIGTHCRGAIFLDGGETITPALEEVIDRIARTFDGFFFGRFDIRVPSRQHFMEGRSIKLVELNGVTSEATHIYDPKLSLFDAYRVLFQQWRIAFEIGDRNRMQGIKPASVSTCSMRVASIAVSREATRNDLAAARHVGSPVRISASHWHGIFAGFSVPFWITPG